MENSSLEKEKDKEQYKLRMESWKVISKMTKSTDQVSLDGKMEKYMRVILENQCLMAEEELFIQTEKSQKGNGKKIITNLFQQWEVERKIII